jgi:hypothetical protein
MFISLSSLCSTTGETDKFMRDTLLIVDWL